MDIATKKLIVLDLEGTLTPSLAKIHPDIAQYIMSLLATKKVAILSGNTFVHLQNQVLSALPPTTEQYTNLALLPVSGTRMYIWRGDWKETYAETITKDKKDRIQLAINKALRMAKYIKPSKMYGQTVEDRGSQITFSGMGTSAPVESKSFWDPTRDKRMKIIMVLRNLLPEFDVRIGGMTSIDITTRGVNKAYGVRKLEELFNVTPEEIVFVGDALFHEGNDFPVRATGVDCIHVHNPEETKKLLQQWVTTKN